MAPIGLVGLPGHGKSYSAIELFIVPAIKSGRKFCTNIPLETKLFEEFPQAASLYHDIDLGELALPKNNDKWENLPKSAIYILDELWRVWPSGLKTVNIPKEQLAFVKEHRHHIDESGQEPDIIFVTQNLSDIASSIRDMVETTIICTKLTELGAKNHFRRDYYRGAIKGFQGPQNAFTTSEQCKYESKIYQFYKSHTKAQGQHSSIDNKGAVSKSVFSGFAFRAGAVAFCIFLIGAIWTGVRTKNRIDDKYVKKSESVSVENRLPVQPTPKEKAKPTKPKESLNLRLVAHIRDGKSKNFVMISDGTHTRRFPFHPHCKQTLEVICTIDGEIVGRFTGNGSVLAQVSESSYFKAEQSEQNKTK